MMKKVLITVLALVCVLGAATAGCGGAGETESTTSPEGTWKFTFNTFFPATNNIAVVGEMWQAEITKRTNGAVQFEYLPGARDPQQDPREEDCVPVQPTQKPSIRLPCTRREWLLVGRGHLHRTSLPE